MSMRAAELVQVIGLFGLHGCPSSLQPQRHLPAPAGRNVCILVGAACAGLALATGRAARAAGQSIKGVVAMGVASLRFNALMTVLGVAHHTGQVRAAGQCGVLASRATHLFIGCVLQPGALPLRACKPRPVVSSNKRTHSACLERRASGRALPCTTLSLWVMWSVAGTAAWPSSRPWGQQPWRQRAWTACRLRCWRRCSTACCARCLCWRSPR